MDSTGDELAVRLRRLLGLIRRDMQALPSRSDERVHNIRVNVKKFRAILRLATFGAKTGAAREADERARTLKACFASARDADVLRELLLDLFDPSEARHLAAALKLDAAPEVSSGDGVSAVDLLGELEALIGRLALARLTPGRIYDSWVRTYQAGRRAGKTAARRARDEDFHEWRKRVKEWLYQSQAIGGVPVVAQRVHRMEKLASLLGSHHDFAMLDARFASHLPDSPARRPARAKKAALARRALRSGESLFQTRPSALRRHFPKP